MLVKTLKRIEGKGIKGSTNAKMRRANAAPTILSGRKKL